MQSSTVEGSKIDALTVIHENGTVNQVSKTLYTAQKSLDAGETKTLSLTLNPSELGTVNIELQKTSEFQLTAKLYFEKPETLTAFQSDIQQLKDLAKELGVQENSLDLQLSLDQGNQQSSEQQNPEYTSWEDREMLFARDAGQAATKASTSSNSYGRKSCSHLDVSA